MIEIEGLVENIVYKNDENGYTVAKIRCSRDLIPVVGYVPFLNEGQKVKIQGQWVTHQTFGKQIKIDSCDEILPSTLEGIEKYLASGLVPGIGPVTAKKIVEKFKEDSLDILEMNPSRLVEVDGIGQKKVLAIAEAMEEQRDLRKVMVFLQGHGISINQGIKIFKRYEQETIQKVKENPYRLCDDISGIGFKTADKIAKNLGMDSTSPYRVMAGIKYVLSTSTANGHTYLPKLELIEECCNLLNVPTELVENGIVSLVSSKQVLMEIIDSTTVVYLTSLYYSELGVARKIVELSLSGEKDEGLNLELEIEEYEKQNEISFAEGQRRAIIEGARNGFCIVTGGPGTGKTTIIKCLIKIFEKKGLEVILAAPTGRAAKRITETTGYEAKTIHRLLEMEYIPSESGPVFARDEGNPLEADVVIIDETSMVDIILMNSLMKAVPIGTKVIMVGDVDQLPSVGPGNVLRDIIESNFLSVVRLDMIFRQSNESLIAYNAHLINGGEMPLLNEREKDFFFIQKGNTEDMVEEILRLIDHRLPSYKNGLNPMTDIQVLSPMRKGEGGVYNLNGKLQEILNPHSSKKNEKKFKDYAFREGDKVMQIKNNYNIEWELLSTEGETKGTGVFNGDIGFIESIDNENQRVSVIFDEDKRVVYDFSNLDELELAYAITIHKSQGSEFKVVVLPISFGPPMLMTRNLIYTAVTRAKELVVLVGIKQALYYMINNNTITQRYSGLKNRIINMANVLR